MARKLVPREFFAIYASKIGADEEKIKKDWYVLVDFIIEELQEYGYVDLPYIGTLRLYKQTQQYAVKKGSHEVVRAKNEFCYRTTLSTYKTFRQAIQGKAPTRQEKMTLRQQAVRELALEREREKQKDIVKRKQERIDSRRERALKDKKRRQKRYLKHKNGDEGD